MRAVGVLLAVWSQAVPAFAQPVHILEAPALQSFWAALSRTQAGQVQTRVAFYGDSHVASDQWTGMLRRALQARFGDAGPGFVQPVSPSPFYAHQCVGLASAGPWRRLRVGRGHEVVDDYGMAGAAVETSSPQARATVTTSRAHPAARFEVWLRRAPAGGTLEVRIDGAIVGQVRTAAARVGPAYGVFTTTDGPHRLELRPLGDGTVRLFGVVAERAEPGVVVDGLGIDGARADAQLLWSEAFERAHLARRDPDLVVLAYGTNETANQRPRMAEYERRLGQVVARVRHAVPRASCLLVGPSDWPMARPDGTFARRRLTQEVIAVQRRVARTWGCGFFDFQAAQGGPLTMLRWVLLTPPLGLPDLVHLTEQGYAQVGDALLRAILP